ncbi:MAG: hypothetical protein IPJ65_16415 [Archangiaceae bacterium]|nr:hypothetical protein [Archangiaceae bacterium]
MLPVALTLLMTFGATEERYDHVGAVGLLMALSGQYKAANNPFEVGTRAGVEVGGSFNLGYKSNELVIAARATFGSPHVGSPDYGTPACGSGSTLPPWRCVAEDRRLHEVDTLLYGGYRGYFGERWKTFVDLQAAVSFTPFLAAGPRLGVGLQYELSSIAGLYTQVAAVLGFGEVLQFRAELVIGVQLRSFLLE